MTEGQVQVLVNEAERIADTLERIETALEGIGQSLEALGQCVGYIPPNYYQKEGCHILRIGGSVDTGNY